MQGEGCKSGLDPSHTRCETLLLSFTLQDWWLFWSLWSSRRNIERQNLAEIVAWPKLLLTLRIQQVPPVVFVR
jgi:hypothetical protein